MTPFDDKGKIDWESFNKLLKFQTDKGIRQFVIAGTTGEGPVLTGKEILKLSRALKEHEKAQNRGLKLMMATGSFSTAQSRDKTKQAEQEWGAEGFLIVCPYYNRPPQKGLVRHFERISRVTRLPIALYNVPSRTASSLSIESVKILSQIENIIGIKEASGDMGFLKQIQQVAPLDFLLLSGDDMTFAEFLNLGGHGAISAGANILPQEFIALLKQSPAQRIKIFEKYRPFLKELYRETNPIGLKQILAEEGWIKSPFLRLPLVAIKNPKLLPLLKSLQ